MPWHVTNVFAARALCGLLASDLLGRRPQPLDGREKRDFEASGFVQHLKLPHYVDFQAELELVRNLRAHHAEAARSLADKPGAPSQPTQELA